MQLAPDKHNTFFNNIKNIINSISNLFTIFTERAWNFGGLCE